MLDAFPHASPSFPRGLPFGEMPRSRPAPVQHWLAAAFDEIDYGVLLVARDGKVIHANHAARQELDASHPLSLESGYLQARRPADVAPLRDAMHSAQQRGLRKMLALVDDHDQHVSLAVVPLPAHEIERRSAVLLVLGKREVCEQLSVQAFARSHSLTPAETRVLGGLCRGERPAELAERLGVQISTVRTQIGSIRQKTGTNSIRALVRKVSVLPPLMGVLRSSSYHHDA